MEILDKHRRASGGFLRAIVALRAPTRANMYFVVRQCGILVLQPRHGEHGHAITELWTFHPRRWRAHFEKHGFRTLMDVPAGLFYTGEMILGPGLGIERRATLSQWLGSSSHVFKLKT